MDGIIGAILADEDSIGRFGYGASRFGMPKFCRVVVVMVVAVLGGGHEYEITGGDFGVDGGPELARLMEGLHCFCSSLWWQRFRGYRKRISPISKEQTREGG